MPSTPGMRRAARSSPCRCARSTRMSARQRGGRGRESAAARQVPASPCRAPSSGVRIGQAGRVAEDRAAHAEPVRRQRHALGKGVFGAGNILSHGHATSFAEWTQIACIACSTLIVEPARRPIFVAGWRAAAAETASSEARAEPSRLHLLEEGCTSSSFWRGRRGSASRRHSPNRGSRGNPRRRRCRRSAHRSGSIVRQRTAAKSARRHRSGSRR